jgi:hypothetical protein
VLKTAVDCRRKIPEFDTTTALFKRIEEDKVVFFHLTGECEEHAATKTTLPPS